MKVHLEADPREILEKGPELIQKLAARLGVDLSELVDPDDLIQKGGLQKEPELKHKALREMHAKERAIYDNQMKEMLEEIGVFLNTTVQKGDYSEKLHAEDQKLNDKVRAKLKQKGYTDHDFDDPRGLLYGMSTNELIDLAED